VNEDVGPIPPSTPFSKVKRAAAPKPSSRTRQGSRSPNGRNADNRPPESVMITPKRAYEPVSRSDGRRILVERLWPRGLSKARLRIDSWLKDVGPSTALRKWFGHDPRKWDTFRRRYARELDSRKDAWRPIVSAARRGPVTLVYSSHDTEHNNAVALQQYLRSEMRRRAAPTRAVAMTRSRR